MLILGLAFISFSISQAAQLKPPTEQEKWFPLDHMYQQLVDSMEGSFATDSDDSYIEVKMAFGLSGMNREGANFWEPCCLENGARGSVIYDPTFDLSTAAAQTFFSDTCAALLSRVCGLEGCNDNRLVKPEDSSSSWCWINQFRAFCAIGLNLVPGTTACTGAGFMPNLIKFRAAAAGQLDVAIGINDGEPFISQAIPCQN
jgi:hypothetical protein